MSKLLIGWAEETLVPEKKLRLAGQFYERISEYVESEITATAMAVESDGDAMILVSADLTSLPEYLLTLVREKFAAEISDVDPMKIIVAATHTHTSHTLADPTTHSLNPIANTKEILKEFMKGDMEYKPLVTADDSVLDPAEATVFVATQIAKAAVARKESIGSHYVED